MVGRAGADKSVTKMRPLKINLCTINHISVIVSSFEFPVPFPLFLRLYASLSLGLSFFSPPSRNSLANYTPSKHAVAYFGPKSGCHDRVPFTRPLRFARK